MSSAPSGRRFEALSIASRDRKFHAAPQYRRATLETCRRRSNVAKLTRMREAGGLRSARRSRKREKIMRIPSLKTFCAAAALATAIVLPAFAADDQPKLSKEVSKPLS